ncbi:hypothetical protein QJS10_CPB14g00142 [Acorus calamus]|uniref:PGG domain-containing protein n=1 Tax=Acorus calamus TaxID=4465 RepID=A0AAV9DDQ7_ACOCL|nr:hypothetical protein QJS10_CPB14g00142 [Acorus calamus]
MATGAVPLSASEILKELRGALLTVGGLIVSATFQAGLNPPSGKENEHQNFINKNTQAFIPPAAYATSGKENEHRNFIDKNNQAFINSIMFIVLLLASYSTTDQRLLSAFLFFVLGSMITTVVYLGLAYTSGVITSGSTDAGTFAGIRNSVIIYACILTVYLITVWWSGKKKENVPANNSTNSAATVEFSTMS